MVRGACSMTYYTQNTMSLVLQVMSLTGQYSVCILNDVSRTLVKARSTPCIMACWTYGGLVKSLSGEHDEHVGPETMGFFDNVVNSSQEVIERRHLVQPCHLACSISTIFSTAASFFDQDLPSRVWGLPNAQWLSYVPKSWARAMDIFIPKLLPQDGI